MAWYTKTKKTRINGLLKTVLSNRINKLIYDISDKNEEESEEANLFMNNKIEEYVYDAFLEANDEPNDMLSIHEAIEEGFYEILIKPIDLAVFDNEQDHETQTNLMQMFVRDTSFLMMKNVYRSVYHKNLSLPKDVTDRIKIRLKNLKATGLAGIDKKGKTIF